MLARTETRRCVECGSPYGAIGFWRHQGNIDNGPAYWSDRGILCSPQCPLAHFRRREAEGSLPTGRRPIRSRSFPVDNGYRIWEDRQYACSGVILGLVPRICRGWRAVSMLVVTDRLMADPRDKPEDDGVEAYRSAKTNMRLP